MSDESEDVIGRAYDALCSEDFETLTSLLHPDIHWRTDQGLVSGRGHVLKLLEEQHEKPARPSDVELRDGQIYRWLH